MKDKLTLEASKDQLTEEYFQQIIDLLKMKAQSSKTGIKIVIESK